jgi:alpha-glucosidase
MYLRICSLSSPWDALSRGFFIPAVFRVSVCNTSPLHVVVHRMDQNIDYEPGYNDINHTWPSRTVYQIYPISFQDSDGDGRGDLQGIISRLDYLKDLGVGAIWLSPIYTSPMADFGYDISNYEDINPMFGTLADFDELLAQAHARGIKVMMDFVPNHTSSEHPWFIESASSRDNAKADWYIWADPKPDGTPPTNWLSVFGGNGWEFDEKRRQYYFHSFLKQQPDLNYRNPEVRAAMENVLKFWLDRGVDGFRVDVAYHIFKDDQLRDNPPNPSYQSGSDPYNSQLNIYTFGLPECLDVIASWVNLMESYGDTFMVTEVYASFEKMMGMYTVGTAGYHSPFNFNLISMPWMVAEYRKFLDEFNAVVRPQDIPNYVLGNHDQPRVASRVGQARARMLAMLQFTMRGVPFIYYGEEIGMENAAIPPELVHDQVEKNVPGMNLGRDGQRTPMQWDSSKTAGFTSGPAAPWLPVNENKNEINVKDELKDVASKNPTSMLALYKRLIELRAGSPAILRGDYTSYQIADDVLVYSRCEKSGETKEEYFIALNFSEEPQEITLPRQEGSIILSTFLAESVGDADDSRSRKELLGGKLILRGNEGIIVITS